MAKGSGRSVADVNLVEVFHRCSHLLDHWGGHPMAAGVSLEANKVEAFTRCFNESLAVFYPDGLPEASLSVSAWLEPDELDVALLEELARLQPFGQGNPEPVFGLRGVRLSDEPIAFGQNNFRFRLPAATGRGIAGIAWRLGDPPEVGMPVDMALRFSWNHWRGRKSPQVTLIDWKETPS